MPEDKENLLYRPHLEPEREYGSEALFSRDDTTNPDPPPRKDKSIELIREFEELKNIISISPKGIQSIIPTIDKLIRRTQVAFPNGYYGDEPETERENVPADRPPAEKPKIRAIGSTVYESKHKMAGLPNLFPKPTNIAINVAKPRSIVSIAVDKYRKDTVDLQRYYLNQMQMVLQAYFHQMLMVMAETNVPNLEALTADFDGKAVKIPAGKNLEHLRDYIVRSQIVREQKSRLFRKTHNVDQTVMHMRSWHVSEKERERYYTEQYGDSASYLSSEANAILRESRSTYDEQYAQSLYDMYKYLNSSVIVISDILDMSLKEAKAKGALLKAGVDIYAVTKKVSHVNDAIASGVGSGKLDEPKNPQSVDSKSKSTDATSSSTKSDEKKSDSANSSKSSSKNGKNTLETAKETIGTLKELFSSGKGNATSGSAKSVEDSEPKQTREETKKADAAYLTMRSRINKAADMEKELYDLIKPAIASGDVRNFAELLAGRWYHNGRDDVISVFEESTKKWAQKPKASVARQKVIEYFKKLPS